MAESIENLSSDEEASQLSSNSAPSAFDHFGYNLGRLTRYLTLSYGHFRDRLRHANPFATPVARWLTLARILCCVCGIFFKRTTTTILNTSVLCRRLRREHQLEHISQFHCMRIWLWNFSSLLFFIDIVGSILTPFALGIIAGILWYDGVTRVKIATSYLTALNLFWLLNEAWAYWTFAQDQ